MAYFKQAIEWLKEGKKVRGESWYDGAYWFLDKTMNAIQNEKNEDAWFQIRNFEATDWEIFKEKEETLSDKRIENGKDYFIIPAEK